MYRRLNALRRQHRSLETQIEEEEKRPAPDAMHVRTLKKFKLRLRDEINRIEGALDLGGCADPQPL
jgi:hypothetical protein